MLEEETVRWMLPQGATIVSVPKFDTCHRGAAYSASPSDREARKRERRERMEEWRQIIKETRISILNEDTAREQICSSFRGSIARDPLSITSYIDGTRHLRKEIERYNTDLKDRILQTIQAEGDMIPFPDPSTSEHDYSLFEPRQELTPITATEVEVKAYNDAAMDHSKEIYMKYPFTRRIDVYNEIFEYEY